VSVLPTDSAGPALPTAGLRARDALAAAEPLLAGRPLLVVSDFDGTLSTIAMDPWAARILPAARRALRALARIEGVHVAVLSGRTAADVAARARVGGATYLGNHGMERGRLKRGARAETLRVDMVRVPARFGREAERIAGAMPELIGADWLVVERKPPAVAFHFRSAPDVDEAGRRVRAAADRLDPNGAFDRLAGRRVLELRPPGTPGKGEAFTGLLAEWHPAVALLLGDDVSDAEAFGVLRRERRRGRVDGLAIGVQARNEVPEAVTAAADLVLASPAEAGRFLAGLVRLLGRGRQLERSESRS
jgi:trehalose 6-phosphate phosphatase